MKLHHSHGVLLGVVTLASIVVMAAPAAHAQCAPAQVFGSTGLAMLGMVQVEIGGGLTGTEIGRFWNAGNSASANNFAETCPANLWMVNRTASGNRGISGGIGESPCFANTCPTVNDEMIWLIEDYGPSGPPGSGDTAGFIGFRMDATPSAARYWDLARAAGNVPVTLPLLPFPQILATSISYDPGILHLFFDLADVEENFWGENAGGPIPDTASIISYDICIIRDDFNLVDPGRLRADWSCDGSIPYTGAPSVDNLYSFSCQPGEEIALAVGMTFSGGAGAEVQSELVGRAWYTDCDTLADPDSVPHLQQRPYIQPRPRRGR